MFAREQEKAQVMWTNALDEMQSLLRQTAVDLMEHLHDRLLPDGDGKKKVFKNTMMAKVKEFLNDFDARNITGDEQ